MQRSGRSAAQVERGAAEARVARVEAALRALPAEDETRAELLPLIQEDRRVRRQPVDQVAEGVEMTARERAAKRIARTIAVLAQGDDEERELADELKSDPEYWLAEAAAYIRKHDAKDEKAAAATAARARIDEN